MRSRTCSGDVTISSRSPATYIPRCDFKDKRYKILSTNITAKMSKFYPEKKRRKITSIFS
jgi:hypothetical protein